MISTVPQPVVLPAPPDWRAVEFISDLHLHESEPETWSAWRHYLHSSRADAIFLLGDIFEVWVGDDAATPGSFEARCAEVLQAATALRPVFFMAGNRDFLLGADFALRCGLQRLQDPTVLVFQGQRWLLSHGDALCLDDADYMQFRAQVRTPEWQQAFLAQPLEERRAVARQLRAQSESRKRTGVEYADLDRQATQAWLDAAQARTLIHGHTHRPADHALEAGRQRMVLSDWDLAATPPRAEVLQLSRNGLQRHPWPPPHE